MNPPKPFLSIIIPIYNEVNRLKNLKTVIDFVKKQTYQTEIILVNDGSTDNSLEIIKSSKHSYPLHLISYEENRGKGYAIKKGMQKSRGEYSLFFDIDLSVPLEEIPKFLNQVGKTDIIIGTRKIKTAKILKHQTAIRENMGKIFTLLSQKILSLKISDFTCGFKLFNQKAVKAIFTKAKIDRWSFDAEIMYLAKMYHLKVMEIPVTWKNDPQTQVKFPQDILNSLKELLLIRINQY